MATKQRLPGIVREALSRIEALLDTLFESAQDAIFLMDGLHFEDCNPATMRMFGCPNKEDIIGKTLFSISPSRQPDGASSAKKAERLVAAAMAGEPQHFEWRYRKFDGTEFDVEVSLHRCFVSGAPFLIAVVRDITDRKLAALERERIEAQAKFLAESSKVLTSSLDYTATLQRVVRFAVEAVADWCIVHLVENGEIHIAEIVHSDANRNAIVERSRAKYRARPDLFTSVENVIQTRKAQVIPEITDVLLREHSSDDEHYDLLRQLKLKSVMLVPLIFGDETLGSMTFIASDARRYNAEDLALAEEIARFAAIAIHNARLYTDAQHAIQARDAVLRMVSHDLRNPVSNIQMSANLLATSSLPDEGRQDMLQMISRTAQRMNRLIEDLMTVGRVQEGREIPLNVDRVDPAVITDEVCAAVGSQLKAKSVDLRSNKSGTIPAIKADRDRIFQVLINLLDNAIKFTPSGGNIILSCEVRDGEVQFAVKDTGPGINPKDLHKIFDPFWQAKPGAHFGSGLGLAIAKAIVKEHNGRIWADSSPGLGTTIFFTMPQADIGDCVFRGKSSTHSDRKSSTIPGASHPVIPTRKHPAFRREAIQFLAPVGTVDEMSESTVKTR